MSVYSDTGPFSIVPEWLLDTDVSDRAVRLYALLSRYADRSGVATPKRKTLARRLGGRSVDSVDRAVKELVGVGALRVEERFDAAGDRTTNAYVVLRLRPGGRSVAATGSRNPAAARNESQLEREGPRVVDTTRGRRTRKRRPGDDVFDALCEFQGVRSEELNRAEQGRVVAAKRDVLESVTLGLLARETITDASEADAWLAENEAKVVAEIERRGKAYAAEWPRAERTATALAANWSRFAPTSKVADAERAREERGARLRERIAEKEGQTDGE